MRFVYRYNNIILYSAKLYNYYTKSFGVLKLKTDAKQMTLDFFLVITFIANEIH